ncbi:MAG: PIG-L family deacetylase [Erysipelotrichales bacterium]|nr:PIG-L family deacetylase [Erysipelotrichales bacterium]
MKLKKKSAEIFIPDNKEVMPALIQTTDLCIAAHQDDLEIMAYNPISECFGKEDRHFTGVVVTNGGGSPRNGIYANYSDEKMQLTRACEQKKAALIGKYSAQLLMSYPSKEVKDATNRVLLEELKEIILTCSPDILYTHNLADKHETHVALVMHVIKAIREIPEAKRPKKIISLEVWRDLDWLSDEDKLIFNTGLYPNLSAALLGVFDSQITGGKRYDLAALGRRLANATFLESHSVNNLDSASYGMDITDLVNSELSPADYISKAIDKFKKEVNDLVTRFL